MEIIRTARDIRTVTGGWRGGGFSIGLVPTMGGIHAGHLALAAAARMENSRVAASLFVNPRQFGSNEDLSAYPCDEAADAARLASAGVDILFAPTLAEIYPDGFATAVAVAGLSEPLCGAFRPGHFDGVATVVAKLLIATAPDTAWFGEKDYQQLQVVKRLVRDLGLPVAVRSVATVREPDGLALSSRNAYLTADERRRAPALHRALAALAAAAAAGAADVAGEVAHAAEALRLAGFDPVDYVAVVDAETLAPLTAPPQRPARAMAAATLGRARLIDNVPVTVPQ